MYTVFVGGMLMEANSFNPVLSTQDTFTCMLEGKELESMRGTSLEVGGVYASLDKASDVAVHPGFYAQACTSGPVKGEDFQRLSDRLFHSLENAGKVDGVLLVLHGAMKSEWIDDCEGYILERARSIVGPDIPICASFDFHALMTQKMMENLDGAAGYLTYPHVDHYETGLRASEALLHLLRSGKRGKKICRRLPLIMSCENSNTIDSPMVPALHMIQALLDTEGVTSGSMFMAQPWLDSPELGCTVSLFYEDDAIRTKIAQKADELLAYLWESREAFYPPMPNIQEALQRIPSMKQPVILVDYGDVPNAGGTGDGSYVLQALLNANLPCSSIVVVADAESTDQAVAVGVGNTATFQIGGYGEPGAFNARIPVTAEVLRLTDEPIVHLGPAQKGLISRPGMRALLRSGNVYIILCHQVCISHDRNMLLSIGVEPSDMGVIAMRATHSFMSCYADVMGSWLYVDTPGYSTRSLKSLPFLHCQRPIYPLDDLKEVRISEVI